MNTIFKLFFLCLFLAQCSYAQDDSKGRLPDGRAYRTDPEGYQLVDYIAELELKIEELQNKLISQDNEKRMAGSSGNIQEADLLSGSSGSNNTNTRAVQLCSEADCETLVQPCRSELASLQQTNDSLTQRVSTLNSQVQEMGSGDDSETLLASIQTSEAKLAEQNQQLAEQNQRLAMLTQNVNSRDAEIASLQNKLANQNSFQSAKTYTTRTRPRPVASLATSSAGNDPTRQSAFQHLKQKLVSDLQEANRLFAERRSLEARYQKSSSRKAAQISLSSMKTQDGSTLNSLQQLLERSTKFSQLGKIQKNIYTMKRLLRADVAILKRLNR